MNWKKYLYLSTTTMLFCGGACLVYTLFVAPNLIVIPATPTTDRQGVVRGATQERPEERENSVVAEYRPLLKILFPAPNDWRADKPNMIEPKGKEGLLLYRNSPRVSHDAREITLDACTIVIFPVEENLTEEERFRRAIVVETSDDATLTFTRPMGPTMQPQFDCFEKAELRGQVVIRGDFASPGPEDDLRLETRDVSLSMTQILAKNPIVFQYGLQNGDGEELTITLDVPSFLSRRKPEQDSEPLNPLQKELREGDVGGGMSITAVELKQLNRLQFPSSVFGKKKADNPTAPPISGAAKLVGDESTVDIRCKSGVRFAPNPEQVGGWVGRFMDDVEVIVFNRDEKHDCLKCKNLYLYFVDPLLAELVERYQPGESVSSRRKVPKGNLTRIQPTMIKAVRSETAPASIDAPRFAFNAEGDELVYDFIQSLIALKTTDPAQSVRLKRNQFSIQAASVQCFLEKNGKFKTIVAGKNGQLEAVFQQGNAPVRFHSSWREALRVTPGEGPNDPLCVSAQGGIDFFLDGMGNISAEEIDFWGRLKEGATNTSGAGTTDEFGAMSSFIPDSARFRGNVRLVTAGGTGNIARELTVRFQPGGATTQAGQTTQTGQQGQPGQVDVPAPGQKDGFFSQKGSLFGSGSSPFELNAGTLGLWVLQDGKDFTVFKLVISDNVLLREKNPVSADEQIKIEGSKVEILNPGTQKTLINVEGNTARFTGKGLRLIGRVVNVNQANNTFAVLGPGRLSFTPPQSATPDVSGAGDPSRGFLAPNRPIDIDWSRKMCFDGQRLLFLAEEGGNVTVSQQASAIRCPSIRLLLAKPISIFDLNRNDTSGGKSLLAQLDQIECNSAKDLPVQVDIVTTQPMTDERGLAGQATGFYRGEFQQFQFNYQTGVFLGKGPGWLKATVWNQNRTAPVNTPSNTASNTPGTNATDSMAATSRALMARPWKHLHMTFFNSFGGNVNQKNVVVNQEVKMLMSSSDMRETNVDIANTETYPKDSIFLGCRQLQIAMDATPDGSTGNALEFTASGNTMFKHDTFFGRAESMKYSDAKKMLYLEGNNVSPASVYRKEHPGAPNILLGNFARGSFNLNTQKVKFDDYSNTTNM